MTAPVTALRFGEAARIQIALLRRLRRVTTIVIACAGSALALEILQARLVAEGDPLERLTSVRLMMLALIGLAWGASLWRNEGPKNRQYFLSHPVDASAHELSRVAAGAFWLGIALASATIVAVVGALVRRDMAAFDGGALPWIGLFTGTMIVYLAVSAIATLTARVAEVLILSYLMLVMVFPLLAMAGWTEPAKKVFNAIFIGTFGLRAALIAPAGGDWSATATWLGALAIWYAVAAGMLAAVLWWRRARLMAR